ncbi:TetR/AcrR family transcriptional regulator [Phenylobacterium sp.]|uniref:TetR/AcrR family transcriptional regulator n=1 Tax=Phenylobacterium sp. TaxID=1871053 RepID=UPI00286BE317|nr:TetR/AcrR family transcriptional regulator [Phenylobacterium sp.]
MTLAAATSRRSARKAKGDGHLRRAEILQAAERIFVLEGYEGATIRKIADEVGVSSTALYMHFPDKGCILLEICEQTLKVLLERNREIAAKPLDPVVRVKMMLEAYMRWGLQHPNAYQLLYSTPRPAAASAAWPEDTVDLSTQCYNAFCTVVREVAACGRLRTGSADAAAQALWMSCHGVVMLLASRPGFAWADRDELIEVTLDGLLNGLTVD